MAGVAQLRKTTGQNGTPERELPERLRNLFEYHAGHCSAYAEILKDAGVKPGEVRTYADWLRVPTISKEQVLQTPPWGFVSGPRENVARFLETSGSTGVPKVLPVSLEENETWVTLTKRFLLSAGFTSEGVTLTAFPQGPWPSGYLIANGAEAIGPVYTADVTLADEWYISKLDLYKPRHIGTLPSFMTRLAKIVEHAHIDVSYVKCIIVGGEHLYPRQREHISRVFSNARLVEGYGSAEVGVCATEDVARTGLYFYDDEYFIEVLDNDGNPVGEGEDGELVISPLFRNTVPIVRYRTGDVIRKLPDNPEAPYPHYSYILSRCDDVLVMGSCKVFPRDVETAISEHPMLSDSHFTLTLESAPDSLLPRLRLSCELAHDGTIEEVDKNGVVRSLLRNSHAIGYGCTSGLASMPIVEIVPHGSLYTNQKKHRRFVDARSKLNSSMAMS